MAENSFQMSQGYDVVPPKPGRAYPILCGEWDHLKSQIRNIKTSFELYHSAGFLLLGVALSTLLSILLGAFAAAAANDPKVLITAWAVTISTFLIGSVCIYFARESKGVADRQAGEVVRQMELIESRYVQAEV